MKRKQAESNDESEEEILKKQKTLEVVEKQDVLKFDARKFRQSLKINDFAEGLLIKIHQQTV